MKSDRSNNKQIPGPRAVRLTAAALAVALALGCSSPQEKVDRFYQRGVEFLQQGDFAKARLEFQNALQIRKDLPQVWFGLAQIAERQNEWEKMFALLSQVIEYDPKHLEAQLKLGRLLLAAGQLDKALQFSDATLALAPDNASALSLRAAVLFKLDDRKAAVEQAKAALAVDPNNIDALVVLASERLAAKDAAQAIVYLDRGLQQNEKNIALQLIKVQAFEALARLDSAEEVYRRLIAFYPDVRPLRHILAQFYLSHGRKEAAEAEYRAIVQGNPADVAARTDLVQFLAKAYGKQRAIQELDQVIAANPAQSEYKFLLAELHQAQGDDKSAQKVLREIIAQNSDAKNVIRAQGVLAGALLAEGNTAEAEKLVADILAKDQRNEQGILLKAGMALDAQKIDQAIADLRVILKDAPDSPRALLLMANAYELSGALELAQEHYQRAFAASRHAPAFGLAYGRFLLKRGSPVKAGDVAEELLQAAPDNVQAMLLLAQARINNGDWAAVQGVAERLRRLQEGQKSADQVLGALQAARRNYEESINSFRKAFNAAPTETQPMVGLVRAYLLAGKTAEAANFLKSVVNASPNNLNAVLLLAQLYAQRGDEKSASATFESAIRLDPASPAAYAGLANLQLRYRRTDDAMRVIAEGLKAAPADFTLQLIEGSAFEVSGRFDDAIAHYEKMLKEHPSSDVVANNLASLLSDHRSDANSLKRAHELAQRFRRSDIPQFKDTLGWATYRVGKASEAVSLLESATRQLPDMPAFRYHLGMNYLSLNKKDAARQEFERALAMGDGKNFVEADKVREALKGL